MYQQIRKNREVAIEKEVFCQNKEESDSKSYGNSNIGNERPPWVDEEDRISNYYITTFEKFNLIKLPRFIRFRDCLPGEVPIWEKRTFPKAARLHKKREDVNAHRYFLSELMLYVGFTNEEDIGSNHEIHCQDLYFENFDKIQAIG